MTSGNINRSLGLSALVIMSVAGLALTGSGTARADIDPDSKTPTFITPSPAYAGDTDFTYGFYVTGPDSHGNDAQYVVKGDYFTIYDFAGFVNANINVPTDWVMSYDFVSPPIPSSPTPAAPTTDNPLVANVTFTYEGSDQFNGEDELGKFTIESIYGYSNTIANDTDDTTGAMANSADDNGLQANFSNVYGPDIALTPGSGPPVQVTPEPGVFVTAASMLSMTGIGLVRGRRRAKGVKVAA